MVGHGGEGHGEGTSVPWGELGAMAACGQHEAEADADAEADAEAKAEAETEADCFLRTNKGTAAGCTGGLGCLACRQRCVQFG